MALLRTQQLINGYTGRQTFGSLHQHSARSWTQTLMLGKVSAIWFTCLGSRYGRTSENHPVFFIWFVWDFEKKEKKKRLGHCYDAIYTLLYLLLSPNNLLRQKKKDIWIKSLVELAEQLLRVQNQSAARENRACKSFHDNIIFSFPLFEWMILLPVGGCCWLA